MPPIPYVIRGSTYLDVGVFPTPVEQVNSGLYRFNAHLFETTITLHF